MNIIIIQNGKFYIWKAKIDFLYNNLHILQSILFFVEKCDNMSIKLKQKRNPSNYQWGYLKAGRSKMDFYLIYKNNLDSTQ